MGAPVVEPDGALTPQPIPIETVGLTKRYGARAAVDRLTFTLPPATCICLLGRNGAGKTTTLHLLMGLRNPTSGDARILGSSLRSSEIHRARRRVGYLPETPVLYPQLTGRELLEFILELRGVRSERAAAIERGIQTFGLAEVADAPIRTYSAGMRKQVAFLAATVHEPEVLILDEPTSTLDVASARRVKETVISMRDRGRAVLFTTHVLEIVEGLADRLAILHDGALRFEGTPDELRQRHGTDGSEALEDVFLRITGGGP